MTNHGFISGPLPGVSDGAWPVNEDVSDWIRCPHCGSEDAEVIHWAEGSDMDFECPDCATSLTVR